MDNRGFEMSEKHLEDGRHGYYPHSSDAKPPGKCGRFCKNNLIMILTFLAVVLGFAIGFGLREVNLSADARTWIGIDDIVLFFE